MKRLLIALALFVFCLSSCTIRKRAFRPGYNVEWKHTFRHAASEPEEKEDFHGKDEKEAVIESAPIQGSSGSVVETSYVDTVVPADRGPEEQQSWEKLRQSGGYYIVPPDTTRVKEPEDRQFASEQQHKIVEPFSWVSLGLSAVYGGLFALVILGLLEPLPILLTLLALLFSATFVFAFISIHRYRKNKKRYYRPYIAALSMTIAGASLIVLLFIGIIYFLNVFFDALFGVFLAG